MSVPRRVFVLGAGRSGTKIFRDCLGAGERVSAIPYDVGYVWRYGNEAVPHDELLPTDVTPEIAGFVARSLERMGRRASGGTPYDVLVEKSVPNTLRPAFVSEIFPDAVFVHIVRNGYHVIESSMRNWIQPADRGYLFDKLRYFPLENYRYALWTIFNRIKGVLDNEHVRLWGPRYNGMKEDARLLPLLEVCARQWARCVDVCDAQLAAMSDDRVLHVAYESLLKSDEQLRHVCDFCAIKDVDSVVDFYRHRFDHRRPEASSSALTEEMRACIHAVAGDTLERHDHV